MLTLKDKVVYPGYGVAQITRILERRISNIPICFFELNFLNRDMTVLVPVNKVVEVGIRPLSSVSNISTMFQMLSDTNKEDVNITKASNWNKRSKDYQAKLRSGNLIEISRIYRDLKFISQRKELSFGEKNLLSQTEELLVEEISLVSKINEDKAIEKLRSCF